MFDKHKEAPQKEPVAEKAEVQEANTPNDTDKHLAQLAQYKDSLLRLQAEFENFKKRMDKEKAQFKQFAAADTVKSFLPVLDSFELALKSMSGDDKITKGMEMIYGQFYSAMEGQGLRPIKAMGERFDPYRHEVLLQSDTDEEKKDGIIVEEFQKGYTFHDAVLRCSKVKILKFARVNGAEK